MNDLNAAIAQAMSICWDETIGYKNGGMALSSADGVDCSGLIGRCLSDAGGFNYPSYHVGTMNMDDNPMSISNTLGLAGFTLIHVTDLNDIPPLQHGDIFVLNSYNLDWSLNGGHTFFYCENITAYTDPDADSTATGLVSYAKVEASSDRGDPADGDHQKNGTGAYWEVWCHAYNTLVSSYYDPQDTNYHNYVTIARWGGAASLDWILYKRIQDIQFHRKFNVN